MKLLVVEDEKSLNKIIVKRLKLENYAVDAAFDGIEALEYLAVTEYDALLLDIMLPRLDGRELLQKIRRNGNRIPVLFLTARDSVQDKVEGLDDGADDYIVKPFEFAELLARLRVILRRNNNTASNILRLADLELDMKKHEVRRNSSLIKLTGKEYEILEYMLHNAGTVLSRQQIQDHGWDFQYDGSSNMIDVYMNTLRKKIDKDSPVKLLHTIRGAGYVLKVETEI